MIYLDIISGLEGRLLPLPISLRVPVLLLSAFPVQLGPFLLESVLDCCDTLTAHPILCTEIND